MTRTVAVLLTVLLHSRMYATDKYDIAFPYQASLRYNVPNKPHFCGGVVVDMEHVVTAARCIRQIGRILSTDEVLVTVGNPLLYPTEEGRLAYHRVRAAWTHHDADLAVLQLTPALRITGPALPNGAAYGTCTVSGWTTSGQESLTLCPRLRHTIVQLVAATECNSLDNRTGISSDSFICGLVCNDIGICAGATGGPLICDGILTGIVSWGESCGYPERTHLFTNVSTYTPWIRSVITSGAAFPSSIATQLVLVAALHLAILPSYLTTCI